MRSGADAVLGALRPPIGDGTLQLCGDGNDGVAMQAALLLAECLAEAEANVKQVSGPASLAEAFSRQIAFRRRWKAPEKTGGLRIFSRRRPAEDAGRPELVTGESRSAATVVEWLDACEVEAGIDAAQRTPGRVALERFGGVYVKRRGRGASLYLWCRRPGDESRRPQNRPRLYAAGPPEMRPCDGAGQERDVGTARRPHWPGLCRDGRARRRPGRALDARRLPSCRRYGRVSFRSGAAGRCPSSSAGSGRDRRRQSGVSGLRFGARAAHEARRRRVARHVKGA